MASAAPCLPPPPRSPGPQGLSPPFALGALRPQRAVDARPPPGGWISWAEVGTAEGEGGEAAGPTGPWGPALPPPLQHPLWEGLLLCLRAEGRMEGWGRRKRTPLHHRRVAGLGRQGRLPRGMNNVIQRCITLTSEVPFVKLLES